MSYGYTNPASVSSGGYGSSPDASNALPPGWERCFDHFGREYYMNTVTRETRSDPPPASSSGSSALPTQSATQHPQKTEYGSPAPPYQSQQVITTQPSQSQQAYTSPASLSSPPPPAYSTAFAAYAPTGPTLPPPSSHAMGLHAVKTHPEMNDSALLIPTGFPEPTSTIRPGPFEIESDNVFDVVLVWGAIVGVSFLGVMFIGMVVMISIAYIMVVIAPAGCCPGCATNESCNVLSSAILGAGVVPRYLSSPVRDQGHVKERFEAYCAAAPSVQIVVENFFYVRHGKHSRQVTAGKYVVAVPVARWEDTSPDPQQFVSQMQHLGITGSMLEFVPTYEVDPTQNGYVQHLKQALAAHYRTDAQQTVTLKITASPPNAPAEGKMERWIIGNEEKSWFVNRGVFFFTLYTTIYLFYAMLARACVRSYSYPVRKRIVLDVDTSPQLVTHFGLTPNPPVPVFTRR